MWKITKIARCSYPHYSPYCRLILLKKEKLTSRTLSKIACERIQKSRDSCPFRENQNHKLKINSSFAFIFNFFP